MGKKEEQEFIEEMAKQTAKRLARTSRPSQTAIGAKVEVRLRGKKQPPTPAIILDTAFSHEGDYLQCKLKIAERNQLGSGYLVSIYPKPVQSYKLVKRYYIIEELDKAEN